MDRRAAVAATLCGFVAVFTICQGGCFNGIDPVSQSEAGSPFDVKNIEIPHLAVNKKRQIAFLEGGDLFFAKRNFERFGINRPDGDGAQRCQFEVSHLDVIWLLETIRSQMISYLSSIPKSHLPSRSLPKVLDPKDEYSASIWVRSARQSG